jgi:serine phosphatase RsbU (regulator of sigma subunit)
MSRLTFPREVELLRRYAKQARLGVVEIGVYDGGTTCEMAQVATVPVYAIDPIIPDSMPPHGIGSADSVRQVCGEYPHVKFIQDYSYNTARNFDAPFDFIFVDGSHLFEDVRRDFMDWFPKLAPGGYIALLERNEAFLALQASREVLANDLATAAQYVRSLLPPPQRIGPITADWRFIPSAALGGDAFGYHSLDDDHIAVYLLDVCGHGVGAALLSVSALNSIRSEALPQTDFHDPGSVLAALNKAFPMERQNDMFFTIWYGVYRVASRTLRWAGGGPAAALLLPPGGGSQPTFLEADGPLIGAVEGLEFASGEATVPAGSSLLVYSDGAFEVSYPDGSMWAFDDFVSALTSPPEGTGNRLDALVATIRTISARDDFNDDFSMVELVFA